MRSVGGALLSLLSCFLRSLSALEPELAEAGEASNTCLGVQEATGRVWKFGAGEN